MVKQQIGIWNRRLSITISGDTLKQIPILLFISINPALKRLHLTVYMSKIAIQCTERIPLFRQAVNTTRSHTSLVDSLQTAVSDPGVLRELKPHAYANDRRRSQARHSTSSGFLYRL
jgi:hypothetical protein